MVFVVCGLNFKTAPLAVREQVALVAKEDSLQRMLNLSSVEEALILSTCNRTEIYCTTDDINSIIPWIAREHNVSVDFIAPYFYLYQDEDAMRHALGVASGLDSMMLGEPQILGQMKNAFQLAKKAGTIHTNLKQIFAFIFRASKTIRNQSGIGKNPVSVAFIATQLVGNIFNNYSSLNILLIGSGETSSLVAKHLHKKGARNFMVAGRNLDNARKLANIFDGQAMSINDIDDYLYQADVVVSATSCPLPFISTKMISCAIEKKQNIPIFLLDLAVPRDIENDVKTINGVYLYNIDDLQNVANQGLAEREAKAYHAEQIIDLEIENYILWVNSLQAKEMICNYRDKMQYLAQQELQKAQQKMINGNCQYQVLEEFSERLVNKLMHIPTIGFKQAASDNRKELLDLANYIFKSNSVTLQ